MFTVEEQLLCCHSIQKLNRIGIINKNQSKGFSLVELIVFISVLAALVSIIMPRFTSIKDKAFQKSNIANGHALANALQAFYLDNESYPPTTWGAYPIGYLMSSWSSGSSPKLSEYLAHDLINPYTNSAYQSYYAMSGAGEITLEINKDGGANGEDVLIITIYGNTSSETLKTLHLGDEVSGGGI